jgi:HSP20 family protein
MLIFRFSKVSGRFEAVPVSTSEERGRSAHNPPVDISFQDHVFTVRMDLPGVNPENLSIEVGDSEVVVGGVIPPPTRPGPCRLIERPSGPFRRALYFPLRIASDRTEALLKDGVLTIRVPTFEIDHDPTRVEIRIDGAD